MASLDAAGAYELHPHVALRPEPFGALAYHYDNRRLTFLRSPAMVELVCSLRRHDSLADALAAAGVPEPKRPAYLSALALLQASEVIRAR